MGMKKKIEGIQFTTRYWLQGKVRLFIKELDYSIEKVSGFNELDKKMRIYETAHDHSVMHH